MLSILRSGTRGAADPTTLGFFGSRRVEWKAVSKREKEQGRGEEGKPPLPKRVGTDRKQIG